MRTLIAAILSLCACVLVACGACVLLVSAASILYPAAVYSLGGALLDAVVIGCAAWAGAELGTFQVRRGVSAGRHGTPLAACAALVTGALLGSAFGIAVTMRADQSIAIALLVIAAAAMALIGGLAATLKPRYVVLPGIVAAAYCVIGGIGFGLAFGLQFAVTYHPCPIRSFCLDPGRWQGLQVGLPAGIVFGLVLGVVVWAALTLDLTVSSLLDYPRTNANT